MTEEGLDPTLRFNGREDDYDRYRPGYPIGIIDLLVEMGSLGSGRTVADIGSGTGIFSAMMVGHGATVYGLEPNASMRKRAELRFNGHGDFISLPGRAEATGLPDASIDLITVAQAFHWFEPLGFRRESLRVLRPGGKAMLIWNERAVGNGGFDDYYARLLRAHDLNERRTRDTVDDVDAIRAFFGGEFATARFENKQTLDLDGLRGRLRSSSYCPRKDDERFLPLMRDIDMLFQEHQENGSVTMTYSTVAYHGRIQC